MYSWLHMNLQTRAAWLLRIASRHLSSKLPGLWGWTECSAPCVVYLVHKSVFAHLLHFHVSISPYSDTIVSGCTHVDQRWLSKAGLNELWTKEVSEKILRSFPRKNCAVDFILFDAVSRKPLRSFIPTNLVSSSLSHSSFVPCKWNYLWLRSRFCI